MKQNPASTKPMTRRSMIKINELTCRSQRVILLLDCTEVTIQDSPTSNLKLACQDQNVYLSNRPQFLWVYRRDNPRGILEEQEKSL